MPTPTLPPVIPRYAEPDERVEVEMRELAVKVPEKRPLP